MEDLTNHWCSLSLSDREGQGLCLKSDQAITEHGILARFLTKRPLNIDAIANTFTPLWRSKSGFKVKLLGNHLVLFSFASVNEVDRILSLEPWSFDKHIMVLLRYNKDISVKESELTKVPFWVQVFDIPLRFRNKVIAEQICDPVGDILKHNETEEWDGGSFIRVRALIDISHPLCRGRLITLEDGKDHWVSFKYERLPNLCYWCGCLTQNDKDCETWIESEGNLNSMNQQFGAWLRAPPFSATRKKVISVPGFFAKKKSSSSSYTSSNSTIRPPSDHQHDERELQSVTDHTPSNGTDVTSDNHRASGACVGGRSTQSINEGIKDVPPIQFKLNDDFEKLIQNLDNEIKRFDGATDSLDNSENLRPISTKATPATAGPQLGPNFESSNLQNLEPTPQCDPAKMDHDQVRIKAQAEGKWLRIQRPTHLKEIQNFEVNLGKRCPPNKLVPPNPPKRRALGSVVYDENCPPTAEAAFRELEVVTRAQDPSALFLAETWAEEARLKKLCGELRFDHCWVGPSAGKTGCLVLLWKNSVKIEVVSSSPNHIDAIIGDVSAVQWRFTGIYGHADPSKKHETWSLIRGLHRKFSLPWLCAGDFNEILWSHEKLGLGPRKEGVMRDFRDTLDECGLMDLGFVGDKFTWRGKRAAGLVLERLDRAVADNRWFALNPGT
ncbi:uncharacterized protein LOC136063823 [Quercus suber]|uniref:uncharacterized protein LOC136063823 n=1 Tax=Quercus suber TaxID=58331 RepID=UPI0032DF09D6